MASVDFTRLLVETIPSPESEKKGLQMDEKIQFVVDDEVVDEVQISEDSTDDISESEEEVEKGTGMLLAGGAAAAGVAATLAWKKFGPGLKAKAKELKLTRLKKKNEKLANKQLAVQTKINQMQKPEPEAGKKES